MDSLTSRLVLNALFTFALMFTTWPTLNDHREAPKEELGFFSADTKKGDPGNPCVQLHFLLPDGVFKVNVVHGGGDAGASSVSLRCVCNHHTGHKTLETNESNIYSYFHSV